MSSIVASDRWKGFVWLVLLVGAKESSASRIKANATVNLRGCDASRGPLFSYIARLSNDSGALISHHVQQTRFRHSISAVFFSLMKTLISFRNLASRRKPDAILPLHMSHRLLKIFHVQWLPGQERMKGNPHYPRQLLTL